MASFNFRHFLNGINIFPKTTSTVSAQGDLDVDSTSGKLNYHNGTASSVVLTANSTDTVKSKTLDSTNVIADAADTTKQIAFSLTGATTAKTLTVSSTQTTSQTLSIPNITAADVVVTQAASQTLTNKTIVGGSNAITGLTNTNLSGSAGITNPNLATMATGTVKGNITGSTATPSDVSATSSATASTLSLRDTNANILYNNVNESFTTTITSGATTTLTAASTGIQQFSGTLTQIVSLPATNAAGMSLGLQFQIFNRSSGIVTVKDSSAATLQAMAAGSQLIVTAAASGSPGNWDITYTITGIQPVSLGGTGQSTLVNHDVLVGAGAAGITQVAPSATSGIPFISQGVSADPTFGTAAIAGGGTGQVTAAAAFNALAPATAKGGLVAGTGTNAYGNLTAGTDNQALIADSSQTTGVRWTTLQQGAKNYITYNNFENNATTGWSLGTVGTLTNGLPTGTPTFGSGAAGTLSISTISSGQLAGTYSMSYASSAATTSGNMVATQSYAIDAEDQAKVMTVKFYYSVPVNGTTSAGFSGTSTNNYAWAVWDVTNSTWLSSAGNFNLVQTTGAGYCTGTFQTGSSTANIRFVLYNNVATTGATTLYVDDFYVGPQTAPMGPAMTDWVPYPLTIGAQTTAPTKATSPLVDQAYWRRVGDTVQIRYNYQHGSLTGTTSGTGIYTWSLPTGITVDTSKISAAVATGTQINSVGVATIMYGAGANTIGGFMRYEPGTGLFMYSSETATGYTAVGSTSRTIAGNASLGYSFEATLPVVGWSSNTSMSSDSDTRVISMHASGATTTIAASASTYVTAVNSSVAFDSAGSYNSGTGVYTVPVSGYYSVTAAAVMQDSSSSGVARRIAIFQNSVQGPTFTGDSFVTSGTGKSLVVTAIINCKAGDTIQSEVLQNTGASINLNGGAGTYLSINRLSGPAVIAATESVNAFYTGGTPTGTLNTSFNVMTLPTKIKDTHAQYVAGTYTSPVTGSFAIGASADVTATFAINNYVGTAIFVNGAKIAEYLNYAGGSVAEVQSVISLPAYPLNAGDLVTIRVRTNATTPIYTAGTTNWFSIARVGN
jgi:hypothetical protein